MHVIVQLWVHDTKIMIKRPRRAQQRPTTTTTTTTSEQIFHCRRRMATNFIRTPVLHFYSRCSVDHRLRRWQQNYLTFLVIFKPAIEFFSLHRFNYSILNLWPNLEHCSFLSQLARRVILRIFEEREKCTVAISFDIRACNFASSLHRITIRVFSNEVGFRRGPGENGKLRGKRTWRKLYRRKTKKQPVRHVNLNVKHYRRKFMAHRDHIHMHASIRMQKPFTLVSISILSAAR